MEYQQQAIHFYQGSDKLDKAIAAGKLIDSRLKNAYLKVQSDIHFDMSNYLKYFSYEALSNLPDFDNKINAYYKGF